MLEIPKSLKGHLLLDSGQLAGSFFHRTVVLICQHDDEGAFGLALNRTADTTVGDVLTSDLPDGVKGQPLYLGGPVQPGALSFLHTVHSALDANVLPDLKLDHSLDNLAEVAEKNSGDFLLRIFAGYSGWSGGQLEEELRRNAWLIHPATVPLIFAQEENLWKAILKEKGGIHRLLAQMPDDLSFN